jgi:hypothetical protein
MQQGREGSGAFCSGGRRRCMEQGGQDAKHDGPDQARAEVVGCAEQGRSGGGQQGRPAATRAGEAGGGQSKRGRRRWIHLGEMEKKREKNIIWKIYKKAL